MSDLLSKGLGKKAATVEVSGKPSGTNQQAASSVEDLDRGGDMLSQLGSKKPAVEQTQASVSSTEKVQITKPASVEESAAAQEIQDSWSIDSALKEVKKLREENKQSRLKHVELLDKIKTEADVKLQQKDAEMQALAEAKLELDRIKADQEDKKRDLSEKLSHRESKLAEMQTLFEVREKDYKKALSSMEDRLKLFEADHEAETQVYKARLDEELAKVPEDFRETANLLVKGAGDYRDAIIALTEAKIKGMFQDKISVVNHSVPNAYDGARSSKEKLQEAELSRRSKLTGQQKIAEAIKGIRSGEKNPAYRSK